MTSPLIAGYLAGLRRRLPAAVADEAADGLIETFEHQIAAGAGEQEAARAALAEFGDLAAVVGEFTRQARAGAPPGCCGRPGQWPACAGPRP